MGKLLGGGNSSKQSSESYNKNDAAITSAYAPSIKSGNDATMSLSALLGLGGDTAGQMAAFDQYKDGAGFNFMMDQGTRAIEGSAAGRGMLNSGNTLKALQSFGMGAGQQYFQQYLQDLFKMQSGGLAGGNLVANTGQYSKSTGTSSQSGGIGQTLGAAASFAALSDRRLKENIELIRYREDGLGVYSYTYVWDDTPRVGVMADEVAELRPDALGEVVAGYQSVNYGAL